MIGPVNGPRPTIPYRAPRPAPAPITASALPAKARAADPLPSFNSPDEFKNYVVNLVASSRTGQADLDAARKAFDEGKGTQMGVTSARERLDAIKLQLALLRDNFVVPPEWSRAKWLGGAGFDKDKFWREQVEVIPGKEVAAPPPAKAAPTPPPAPPAPARGVAPPAPVAATPALAPGDRTAFEGKLKLAALAHDTMSDTSRRDSAIAVALTAAVKMLQSPEEATHVAKAARDNCAYRDDADPIIVAALTTGAGFAKTGPDFKALAENANTHIVDTSKRDSTIKVILNQAINRATNLDEIRSIVMLAQQNMAYPDDAQALTAVAMAKAQTF